MSGGVMHLRQQLRDAEASLAKLQAYLATHHQDVPKGDGIVDWAINAMEQYRYQELEHEHLGCHVAETGIYAKSKDETLSDTFRRGAELIASGEANHIATVNGVLTSDEDYKALEGIMGAELHFSDGLNPTPETRNERVMCLLFAALAAEDQ